MSKYKQLVFDEEFNITSEVVYEYYKEYDDMKEEYKYFVNKIISSNNPLFCYDDYYLCNNCLERLEDGYCSKCNIKYNTSIYFDYYNYSSCVSFLIFDVCDDDVVAYIVKDNIKYYKYYEVYRKNYIVLDKALLIKEDGVYDLNSKEFYSFKMFEEFNDDDEMELLDNNDYSKVFNFFMDSVNFVYTGNLELLKNSPLYKYSGFNKNMIQFRMSLYQILCYPVYYKSYEYLVKLGLYNLANNTPYVVSNSNSFYSSFGVSKNHYEFMKRIDIDYKTLMAMRIYSTEDTNTLDFIKSLIDVFGFKELKELNFNINRLKEYLSDKNIYDYYDYIECAKMLKLKLDNNVLYTKDFMNNHDKLYKQVLIINDKEIDNKIKNIYEVIKINKYEDDKYVIFPASSIDELLDESNQMSNCVKTYSKRIVDGLCQIYFMRLKSDVNKSLVTVEVKDNKVVQARSRFNNDINEEERDVLKNFENSLLPIKMV
jgi:hypothetical protein